MTKRITTACKKWILRMGFCVAMIALMVLVGTVMAGAEEWSGEVAGNRNISWTYDTQTAELVLSGKGDLPDYDTQWADFRKQVRSVIIEDGITGIDTMFFYDFSSLEEIRIGNTVEWIGYYAFQQCSALESIEIPGSVKKIYAFAFYGCSSLKTIVFNEGIEYFSLEGFVDSTPIELIIPSTVTQIDHGYNLNLQKIEVRPGNPVYHSSGNCLIETSTKEIIQGCDNSVIPADGSVTTIGASAFSGCNIKSISIPVSVQSIEAGAFSQCEYLTDVYYDGNHHGWRKMSVDEGNTQLLNANIHILNPYHGNCGENGDNLKWVYDPENCELIISGNGKMMDGVNLCWDVWREDIHSIVIEDGVTSIGEVAFSGMSSLTNVVIGNTVEEIQDLAFTYCSAINSIIIPGSVKVIGQGAFCACSSLKTVTLSEGIEHIRVGAFELCDLREIVIPSSVVIIDDSFFSNENLLRIEVREGNPVYHSSGNCLIETDRKRLLLGITNSVIPEDGSVTTIASSSFHSCGMVDLVIPDAIKQIDPMAFGYCKNLTSVTLPNKITVIGDSAFWKCENLTEVTIPISVKRIERDAFYQCDKLKNIYYAGTSYCWSKVSIDCGNEVLQNANVYYGDTVSRISGASLSLGQSLTMKYYAVVHPDYDNAQMRFTYCGEVFVVPGVFDDGEYVFSLDGIAPQHMNNNIKAELILIAKDGSRIVVDVKRFYSVRQYCDDALAADPDNKVLVALLADLLAYGDAAQVYTGYQKDHLASEGFAVTPSDWKEVADTDFVLSEKKREDIRFTAAGLRFDYINRIYFKILAADLTDLTVTVNGKVYTAADLALVEGTDNTYILYTDVIYSTEFDRIFTAELAMDGEVVQTVSYSVKSYIFAKQNSENKKIANLVKALYNYGCSSINYLQNQ